MARVVGISLSSVQGICLFHLNQLAGPPDLAVVTLLRPRLGRPRTAAVPTDSGTG
jgi:hypothetical protein